MIALEMPELFIWLMKLSSDREAKKVLLTDPVAYASFYVCTHATVPWSDAVKAKAKYASGIYGIERMLEMVKTLDSRYGIRLNADEGKVFGEGLAAFDLVAEKPEELEAALSSVRESGALEQVENLSDKGVFERNLDELGDLLGFSPAERFWMRFSITLSVEPAFFMLMDTMSAGLQTRFPKLLSKLSDIGVRDMEKALDKDSSLVKSGLLSTQVRAKHGFPSVSEFWLKNLAKEHKSGIAAEFVVPFVKPENTGSVGRMKSEDEAIMLSVLRSKGGCKGVNVLVHGSRSIDKQSVVWSLISKAKRKAVTIRAKEASEQDLPCVCMIVMRHLEKSGKDVVLVTDKSAGILRTVRPSLLSFFGMDEDADAEPAVGMDDYLLAGNGIQTIWIVNSPKRLDENSLGKFLFHAEVRRSSRKERGLALDRLMKSSGWSPELREEVLKFQGVSEQQLLSAMSLSKVVRGGESSAVDEKVVLCALERSQKALDRRDTDDVRMPITKYSLDYLNTAGRFRPEQIIQALRKRSSASLCFYGLPGTGKTQLAEHIAFELGKQLVMKRASDIYDKYLGESEKRIAEMFVEAEEEDAVLLLDEADSFLRDRNLARASWEVTVVNELLQRMERFPGVFICATNLFRHIDIAALRRFMFKLEFLPLNERQRWQMFINETGFDASVASVAERDALEERLLLIRGLTPGDFAVVKRQCKLLEETLTPDEWIRQLEVEVAAKRFEEDKLPENF